MKQDQQKRLIKHRLMALEDSRLVAHSTSVCREQEVSDNSNVGRVVCIQVNVLQKNVAAKSDTMDSRIEEQNKFEHDLCSKVDFAKRGMNR
ncbi:hypothetical protein Bca52824_031823 [Brassica carinata]|uniref:Uncharacterized protein n=1 Tax=Brassica carinata TaxID=52824 RepID=A0A8X7SBD9_BRACI|nr:hypothetical protein Bca52824_031823 [Brassica carinata]